MRPETMIADFDSATAMLRAVARAMRGDDMPMIGTRSRGVARALEPLAWLADRLPDRAREWLYIRGGELEAIDPRRLGEVDAEAIARWSLSLVRRRAGERYPAVAIGSSNGALSFLWAALGVPWLPQTLLVPVRRRGVHPDEPIADMEWGRRHARALLDANPELALHHMNDPVQDRLMLHRMTYFRVKRRALGEAYERFLSEAIAPGGTIFVPECTLSWGTTRLGPRHVFQHGALGGAREDEVHAGGPRVARYLHEHRSHRLAWEPPPIDGRSPEAEWGFDPMLLDEIEALARRRGLRVRRIVLEQPEDASPLVADLYRTWYAQRRIEARRLLVQSFILLDPYWTLRTASVPFWIVFNTEPSREALARYLDASGAWDAIHMTLFSHGVDSIGLVPLDAWAALRSRARHGGALLGTDARAFPRDFGNFVRYDRRIRAAIPARYPLPPPMTIAELDAFLAARGDAYRVRWIDGPPASPRARPLREANAATVPSR